MSTIQEFSNLLTRKIVHLDSYLVFHAPPPYPNTHKLYMTYAS